MSDYDAIVVGAGHNGLTAAAILQQADCARVCLEANHHTGGMAATVELIDGFRYEIAGSVQFPMPSQIAKELGLDTLPTVDAEVMSVNLGDEGEEPMIFYRDPMQFFTHLADKHGTDAVTGMAGLIGWSQGPAKALGRFDVRTPPKTLDEMYACAASEAERTAIHDVLFGTAMDAIDRYLPDKQACRAAKLVLAFLAINSTYRGPYTSSATCFGVRAGSSRRHTAMMTKLEGGIRRAVRALHQLFVENGGESGTAPRWKRFSSRTIESPGSSSRRIGNQRAGGRIQPVAGSHSDRPGRRRAPASRPRNASERPRSQGVVRPDPLRARRPARVRAALRFPQRTRHAGVHRNLQFA
jgi:phytoene dehydrogenase-like protein